jgi:cytochrome c oxidase subunit 2
MTSIGAHAAAGVAAAWCVVALLSLGPRALGEAHADVARPHPGRRVAEFDVVAKRFSFTPDRIEVTRGDRVRLTVRSADGTHGLAIKKFKIDVRVPRGGEPVVLEFDADQAGEFPITCSEYCGKGHRDMKALLVVRDPQPR